MKKFKLDFSFLILIIFLFLSPKQYLIYKLLLCLLLHEFGHIILIILFRYKIANLRISIFGFFLELDKTKEIFIKDLMVYLGGILANLLCFFLISDQDIRRISLFLLVINILPIYPLDGFNVLKTILSYLFPYYYASKGMCWISIISILGVLFFGILYQIDLFIILSFFYLLINNIELLHKHRILYKRFLVNKALYRYSYPIKKIKFHEKYLNHLYKYHEIEIQLNQKIIKEIDLLRMEQLLS